MDTKQFFKDVYDDFFGVEKIKAENEKLAKELGLNQDYPTIELNKQDEAKEELTEEKIKETKDEFMLKSFEKLEKLYITEQSKNTLKNIKIRILENDYIRQEKIIPYMVIRHRRFTTRDGLRKKYKPKGIIALYYYYRYLIKLYTRNNTLYKLTPKMRKEVKKMDEYSERIRFLCKYKIETMSDIDNMKEKKQEEMQKILNTRNRLYYKRQKLNNESEKDSITKKIIDVTAVLTKVRKEIKLCDEIYNNVPNMKEQIKKVDEKEKQKIKEQEQEKKLKEKKKKVRRYER